METRSSSPALIEITELGHRLNLANGTIYNWCSQRRIPFIKAGRCLRFDYEAVFRSLREHPIRSDSAEVRRG